MLFIRTKNINILKTTALVSSLLLNNMMLSQVAFSQTVHKKPATCLLEFKKQKYIHGACTIEKLNSHGSFVIRGKYIVEGQDTLYTAYLYVDRQNKTTATSAIAKSIKGIGGVANPIDITLHKNKGCWLNNLLKICAYEKAKAPDNVRNKNETVEQIRDYYEDGTDGTSVLSLQERLSELGYYKGELDNIWGGMMYEAMEETLKTFNKESTLIDVKDKNAVPKFLQAIAIPENDESFTIQHKEPETADLEKEELTEAEIATIETSEAIRLAGIDLSMSELLQRKILTKNGYICEEAIHESLPTICKKEQASIRIKKDELTFNCHNFNVCHMSFEELAQDVVDSNIVESVDYDTSSYVWAKIQIFVETYCGRGNAGDSLCVKRETQANGHVGGNLLKLKKDALGKGSSSYN